MCFGAFQENATPSYIKVEKDEHLFFHEPSCVLANFFEIGGNIETQVCWLKLFVVRVSL